MAGLILKPHPPNFENQYNFEDVQMLLKWFLISLHVSDFQRLMWNVLSISAAVHGLLQDCNLIYVSTRYESDCANMTLESGLPSDSYLVDRNMRLQSCFLFTY